MTPLLLIISIGIGICLIVLPARYLIPPSQRLSFTAFSEAHPQLIKFLYLREVLFLFVFVVAIMVSLFFAYSRFVEPYNHATALMLTFGAVAAFIGLMELISGFALVNGYGGRWLRRQQYIVAPRVRFVGQVRCGLSLFCMLFAVLIASNLSA